MKEETSLAPSTRSPLFFYIILFFLGIGVVYGVRIVQVKLKPPMAFSPSVSTLTLSPPRESFSGQIVESSGVVEKRGREDEEFKPLQGTTIVQDDSIATKQSNIEILLNDQTGLKLLNNSEIGFVNLLPNSLLFKQVSGTITYKPFSPISIRVLHTLIETTGTITVSIDQSFITLNHLTIKTKIGLVDLENNTQVYVIKPGETAVINDEIRSVKIK